MKIRAYNSILSCIAKYLKYLISLLFNKKIIHLLILNILSACTSPTAMLGPVYTFSTTGNIYQTGLSYGSNQIVEKITGKTPVENFKDVKFKHEEKNIQKQTLESEDFYFLVKNKIEKIHIETNNLNQ